MIKKIGINLWMLIFASVIPLMPTLPQPGAISLSFSQIAEYAGLHSPEIPFIQRSTELERLDSQLLLRPSNPTLDYNREFVKNNEISEREQVFSLSKSFEMPWIYSKKRQLHRQRTKVLELEKDSRTREFLCRMKATYVALSLMNDRLETLREVEKYLIQAAAAAENRKKEGFLTGYQKKVIDIALLNLKGKMLQTSGSQRSLENLFRSAMGIAVDTELLLTSAVQYNPLPPEIFQINDTTIEQLPAVRLREEMFEALKIGTAVEKLSAIPEITLSAGYKTVGHQFKGYTAGLSLGLPLLDQNKINISKGKLELEIHNSKFELFKKESIMTIREKISKLQDYGAHLGGMDSPFRSVKNQLTPIVLALEEGTLAVNDFVNILQTYNDGMDLYYIHLQEYFDTLFQLEVLTGKDFVTL